MTSPTSPHPRSRSRSSDHNERLEPHLLRAAEKDDVPSLTNLLTLAQQKHQLNENFLRIGLSRSAEKGAVNATRFLLSRGAPPDGAPGNRLSPLLRAVERNHVAIVHVLLEHGASPETGDKKGRTALMTAAWKNHWHVLELLINRGANPNAQDERGRNVLHNLAADKVCDWGVSVVELLIGKTDVKLDGDEGGRDKLGRTPLHWACATGKRGLAEILLKGVGRKRGAAVDAVEIRGKTSLHLAASHEWDDIVELLLRHGADVHARSDGGWTPLHNACEVGTLKIVQSLLRAESDVNVKLLNGATPLHLAAQGGHVEVVKALLACRGIKRAVRDSFGSTPFLRAALGKNRDIVGLLAPENWVEGLSEDALGACNGFEATIVDFGNFRNENRVKKWTVYELLYGRDLINPRKPKLTILPNDKATEFRWVHLPANNMAWVEVLLTKLFIEEGASDVEGFKALERSFSHQHRGQQSHSHFMRPVCQSTPRAPRERTERSEVVEEPEPGPPTIVINGGSDGHGTPKKGLSRASTTREDSSEMFRTPSRDGSGSKSNQKDKNKKGGHAKGSKSPKIGTTTPSQKEPRKTTYNLDRRSHSPSITSSTSSRKDTTTNKGNIFLFMPYLHFESTRRRQEMQDAIKRAENLRSPFCPYLGKASSYDEMLIRAHLATSTASLHVRRTLDQSFYHNIDTESRDQDQVVYRYQIKGRSSHPLSSSDPDAEPELDPKIIMIDQLWLWVLGPNLILTAFPQRWQQPKNDPLNVLSNIIEDINSKTRAPISSVYELAITITARCTGVFDRQRMVSGSGASLPSSGYGYGYEGGGDGGNGGEEYQFLDMFESSIGSATDRETLLFKEFNAASAQASLWLQHHRRKNRMERYLAASSASHDTIAAEEAERAQFTAVFGSDSNADDLASGQGPLFIDKLLDIGLETDLLAETKDIRDELNMITSILTSQLLVLPSLSETISSLFLASTPPVSSQNIKRSLQAQIKGVENVLLDLERMDRQAERIYGGISDMLDLKQKHANAFEARFARDAANETGRQGRTIMVFTIVTIVFLPLSFIAAFFAINIQGFPKDGGGGGTADAAGLPLGWVAKYMFGIGFAVSIPMIVVALRLDDLTVLWRYARLFFAGSAGRRRRGEGVADGVGGAGAGGLGLGSLDVLRLREARSKRRVSGESLWTGVGSRVEGRVSMSMGARPGTAGTGGVGREGGGEKGLGSGGAGGGNGKVQTGFRIRGSTDIERGLGVSMR